MAGFAWRFRSAIQKRALAEGLPYQTLIASLLHKYKAGQLKEISTPHVGARVGGFFHDPFAETFRGG